MWSFYPVRRFLEAGRKTGISVHVLLPRDIPESGIRFLFPPDTEPCALVRGPVPRRIFTLLEAEHIPYSNTLASRLIADNKIAMYRFLANGGWPIPAVRAVTANGAIAFEPYTAHTQDIRACFKAEKLFGGTGKKISASAINRLEAYLPLIVKPAGGSKGRGVRLLKSVQELEEFFIPHGLPYLQRKDSAWIFQEYLGFRPGCDLRVFFCAGTILACVERQGTGIVSNTAEGALMKRADIPEEYTQMALDIAARSGLRYGTVDFLWKNNTELSICEINACPGFEALETQALIPAAEAILAALTAPEKAAGLR